MKRIVIIIGLCLFIGLCGLFITIKFLSLGPPNNFFNQYLRFRLARQPALRQIFALNDDGDAAADYLGKRYSKILVEVDSLAGSEASSSVINNLVARIQVTTGKPTTAYYSDTLPAQTGLTASDIDALSQRYRSTYSHGDTAVLYVLVLHQKADEPQLVGSTHGADEIILYTDAVKDFAVDSPATLANYELATLLHEFGHQLGLGHNNTPGCVMNPHLEDSGSVRFDPKDVVVEFCPLEQQLIQAQRAQFR